MWCSYSRPINSTTICMACVSVKPLQTVRGGVWGAYGAGEVLSVRRAHMTSTGSSKSTAFCKTKSPCVILSSALLLVSGAKRIHTSHCIVYTRAAVYSMHSCTVWGAHNVSHTHAMRRMLHGWILAYSVGPLCWNLETHANSTAERNTC